MSAKRISLVTTVRNHADECVVLLDSLPRQTRMPDEIIVVDGGSTPEQLAIIKRACDANERFRLIESPGANIGRGRNIGVESALGDIILSTDTGCRLDPQWAERMIAPFEDDRRADFVAGFYKIDPRTFIERVIGTTTMRGALDPVNRETFDPSARSMAFTKDLWERAGGIPDFLAIDDTLYDTKIRAMNIRWVFVEDAIVHWRPRSSLGSFARQMHFYGTAAGHTQLHAENTWYNIRNIALCSAAVLGALWRPALWFLAAAVFAYFWVHGYHHKSWRVMRAIGDWRAYPLALCVHWLMMVGDTTGYLTGTLQRWRNPARYRDGTDRYMRAPVENPARNAINPSLRSVS